MDGNDGWETREAEFLLRFLGAGACAAVVASCFCAEGFSGGEAVEAFGKAHRRDFLGCGRAVDKGEFLLFDGCGCVADVEAEVYEGIESCCCGFAG